nr:unnamed protein product [Callosobruchus chinensis]
MKIKNDPFLPDTRRDPSKTNEILNVIRNVVKIGIGRNWIGSSWNGDGNRCRRIRRQRNEIQQIKEKVEKLHRTASRSPRRRTSPYRRSLSHSRSSPKRKDHQRHSPAASHRRRSSSREQERRRRRSRTRSPKRSRKDEKKSFLEEIVEKLNDTSGRLPMHMQVPIMPTPQQAPVPIQQPPMMEQYIPPVPVNVPVVAPGPVPAPVPPPAPVKPDFLPQPMQKYDLNFFIGDSSPQINSRPQLFQDKKITLSQFLSISAKPEASTSNPAELREKVKDPLHGDTNQRGEHQRLSGCIDRLLKHLGLQSEVIEIDDKEDRASSPLLRLLLDNQNDPVEQSARTNCPDCEKRRKKYSKIPGRNTAMTHVLFCQHSSV